MPGIDETEACPLSPLVALAMSSVDLLSQGQQAKAFGFTTVDAGPLVRSTYNAHEVAEMNRVIIA